jgi:membrane protease subunit (stomatin/prohibitin family)
VALGTYGTTLLDELNRLANGGTYRASGAMVGEALAARQWAVQRSVTTNLTDTVGVLNAIAGTTSSNRLDYNGVCNALASTFQLPAAQALRGISS